MSDLLADIKQEEGFNGMPYRDNLGFLTIGYGIRLPLDKTEGEWLLQHRLDAIKQELNQAVKREYEHLSIPQEAWDILDNMAYQMGVPRLMGFKRMWKALSEKNYSLASIEMIDSEWHRQTPERADRLADRMKNITS